MTDEGAAVSGGDKITANDVAADQPGGDGQRRDGIVMLVAGPTPRFRVQRHLLRFVYRCPGLRRSMAAMLSDFEKLNDLITGSFYIYSNGGRDIHMRFAYNPEGSDNLMMLKEYLRRVFTDASQRTLC